MRKILITNDDGITSDGLVRLARAASKLGEVWVIAPDGQRSAKSHAINLHDPIDVFEVDFPVDGVHAYMTTGTPADCVRFGILNFVKSKPDLVLSGINFGYNCGSDLQYSATVGAALEGASVSAHSIAFSEGANGVHEVTDAYLDEMLLELLDKPLGRNRIWNVNFPECPLSEFKGILRDRKVASEAFYIDTYSEEPIEGGIRLRVDGVYREDAEEGTDFEACVSNCISVGIVSNVG